MREKQDIQFIFTVYQNWGRFEGENRKPFAIRVPNPAVDF